MKLTIPIIILTMILQIGISQNLIPFRIGDKWGYANEKGELIIKPKYEEVGEFRDELTWVKKNGKYGYINKKGRKKTWLKYDEASYFGFGTASVRKGDKKHCINLKGRKSKCRFGCGGVIAIRLEFQKYEKEGKIGILRYSIEKDIEGESVQTIDSIPALWNDFKGNQKGYAAVKRDSLWGVINKNGELVTGYEYELIEVHSTAHRRNKFFKVKQKGKYGYLNEKGELVVEPIYHKSSFFTQNGIAKVWINDDFWGYIDESGKEYFERN